jgi:hypothetical protein
MYVCMYVVMASRLHRGVRTVAHACDQTEGDKAWPQVFVSMRAYEKNLL